MIPIAITPVLYQRGTGGVADSGVLLPDIRDAMTAYTHTIAASGGFESCKIPLALNLDDALAWLQNLGASIVVFGPDAQTIWEGQLVAASLQAGAETVDLSLDDMANAVRVRYQPGIGAQTSTAFATDATSIATYGRKELVYGGSGMIDAAATALRDKLLSDRRQPKSRRSGGAGTGGGAGEVRLTLTGAGWFFALDWLTTSSTTSATAVTTEQLKSLITAYNAINAFYSTSYGDIAASGESDTQWIDPDTPYREKVERLMSIGDSSGQRLAYGVYEGRQWRVRQWAGANPTAIGYVRSLGEGLIRTPGGAVVDPWDVRPDAMYQVLELIDPSLPTGAVDQTSAFYVERVTCEVSGDGLSVRLDPAKSGELDVLLARLK